jgi:hypothetical protein
MHAHIKFTHSVHTHTHYYIANNNVRSSGRDCILWVRAAIAPPLYFLHCAVYYSYTTAIMCVRARNK